MMGNITFVKDSTSLQPCGSFIFKSNKKKPVPRVSCLGLLFGVDIEILIRGLISRVQGDRCRFCLETHTRLGKRVFGLEKLIVPLAFGLWAHAVWWRDLSSFTQSQSRTYQLQGHANKSQPGDILSGLHTLDLVTNKPRANSAPRLKTFWRHTNSV